MTSPTPLVNISPADLAAEARRALAAWPFLPSFEAAMDAPPGLLLAVGSRETNLTNEVGDGGHGHGVWQLDDRSHTIPAGFDTDVQAQARVALGMLVPAIHQYGLRVALAAYNAGLGNAQAGQRDTGNPDQFTTGGDYGADVAGRLEWLVENNLTGHPATSTTPTHLEDDMPAIIQGPNGAAGGTVIVAGPVAWYATGSADVAPYEGCPTFRVPGPQFSAYVTAAAKLKQEIR